ncbi:hypothetical protein [Lactiplantibacillus herbarum]|uniref:hypothetical protein n=1 Tax=Lactiplantibacillus herbarum TaxID=1670446 RepID=UPI00064E5E47|nr:hypothetical protein [Lactiplantibacillus herbarum]
MQGVVLNHISVLVDLSVLLYLLIAGIVGIFVIRQYHTNTPVWQFKKYRKIRTQFLMEPIHKKYKLTVMSRLGRLSVFILVIMNSGQVLIYEETPYLSITIVGIASLVMWFCSNSLRRYRRMYWKETASNEFELVSDRRFLVSQFLIGSLLAAVTIQVIIFSVYLGTS